MHIVHVRNLLLDATRGDGIRSRRGIYRTQKQDLILSSFLPLDLALDKSLSNLHNNTARTILAIR